MVGRESRIAVVVNGNAKNVNEDVISTIDQILKGGDLFVSRHIDEAPEIARTIVEGGYGTVLTGGGDGTFTVMVTEVVKACERSGKLPPRFGLLKLGTGNALAWVIGASSLGKKNVTADIDRLLHEAGSRRIHLVRVEGYLTPFTGLGADAQILADYNVTKTSLENTPLARLGRGLTGYGVAAVTRSLPTFLYKPIPHLRITNTGADAYPVDPGGIHKKRVIRTGEVLFEGKARMAALSTIPYYGFGMRLFPFAEADPERMNLRVSRVGSPQFLRNIPGIWAGSYHDPKYLQDFLVQKVRIESNAPLDFQIGGDSRGKRSQIDAALTEKPLELVDYYDWPG